MSAIVLQTKRKGYTATAIGPFETSEEAEKHATDLCRQDSETWVYSVLSLVPPADHTRQES